MKTFRRQTKVSFYDNLAFLLYRSTNKLPFALISSFKFLRLKYCGFTHIHVQPKKQFGGLFWNGVVAISAKIKMQVMAVI